MQVRDERVLDTGQSVQAFATEEAAAIGTAVTPELRAQLDAAVAQLKAAQVDHETLSEGAKAEVAKQDATRKELSADFLIPLGRIVRRAFPKSPDFEALIVPAQLTRKNQFVAKVESALVTATAHAQELIGKGMPADFVPRMQALVGQLTASTATRASHLGNKSEAVKAIDVSVKAIRDVVHIIDGNMRRELKNDQPLLAKWNTAKRVQATPVTPLPGGGTGATTAAPVDPPAAGSASANAA